MAERKQYTLTLDDENDSDIIRKLESVRNTETYFKILIRADIAKEKSTEKFIRDAHTVEDTMSLTVSELNDLVTEMQEQN